MTPSDFSLPDIHADLYTRFGAVMTTEEVAGALKMTVPALRMARSRKAMAIRPMEIEGRRGQIYCTADVARLLTSWIVAHVELTCNRGQAGTLTAES